MFAQATDPEVFLLIQTHPLDGVDQWHFGLARMNSVEFRVIYREKEVQHFKEIAWRDVVNREAGYTVFYRQ